jgi:hypothetical protein
LPARYRCPPVFADGCLEANAPDWAFQQDFGTPARAGISAPFCVGTHDVTAVAVAVGRQGYAFPGSGESEPVPNQKKPTESNCDAPVERRGQSRGEVGSTDWETIVLKRVERHVESLSGDPNSQLDALNESGWEEAALLALRRRIRDLKPG